MGALFLEAVRASAQDTTATIDELAALRDQNEKNVAKLGRGAKSARQVLRHLQAYPIIEIGKTADALGLSCNNASDAVNRLVEQSILVH